MSSSALVSTGSKRRKAASWTVRPERRIADSSRRSPYVSGGPQCTWNRPFVSTPPMSMHSIGQACAHWKHVSHFSVPYSSYRSWRRPRNFGATSALTSGYLIVALGWKNRRSVRPMPRTMPMPGTRLIGSPELQLLDDDDRRRGDEQVEERRGQEPLPREAHQLVDPDAGERAAHPHEDEHEDERLDHEPGEARDPVELDVREAEQEADYDDVEHDEAEDEGLPAGPVVAREPEREGEQQRQQDRGDRDQQQQADAQAARVER